jgi:hypothetical protein
VTILLAAGYLAWFAARERRMSRELRYLDQSAEETS